MTTEKKSAIEENGSSFNSILNQIDALKHQFGSDPSTYSTEIRDGFRRVANEILEELDRVELNGEE